MNFRTGVTFQVASKVKKPLVSAGRIAIGGFAGWLDGPGQESYIMHKKTGQKTALALNNGMFTLDVRVRSKGFPRPRDKK